MPEFMRKLRWTAVGVVMLVIAGHGAARAQEGVRVGLTPAEKDFVTAAAMTTNYQIAAAKVALAKSKNDVVRRYAEGMITDHTAMAERLAATVRTADPSMQVPTTLDLTGQERLRALSAAVDGFDLTYRGQMMSSHTEEEAAFRAFLENSTTNAGLRGLIGGGLPVVQAHLGAAKELPRRT
ncbi:MAG: DUF4142 domain-containing protein [Gemmatimonadales bacterium]